MPYYDIERNLCLPEECTVQDLAKTELPERCKPCNPGYEKIKDEQGALKCFPTKKLCEICNLKKNKFKNLINNKDLVLQYKIISCLTESEFFSRLNSYLIERFDNLTKKYSSCVDHLNKDSPSDIVKTLTCMNDTNDMASKVFFPGVKLCDPYAELESIFFSNNTPSIKPEILDFYIEINNAGFYENQL